MATFVPEASRRAFVPAIPPVRDMTPVLDAQEVVDKLSAQTGVRAVLRDEVLDEMAVDELLELRGAIESRLPPSSLKDVDLERELVLQFKALQALQSRVINDDGIPANQRSQTASALSAALVNLRKLQDSEFDSERVKLMESVLIDTVNEEGREFAEAFLSKYEAALSRRRRG